MELIPGNTHFYDTAETGRKTLCGHDVEKIVKMGDGSERKLRHSCTVRYKDVTCEVCQREIIRYVVTNWA